MRRLVLIGIDGMDADIIEQLGSDLPNLSRLRTDCFYRRCLTVFPPDSVPAWVTIFTGQHPARHGWLDSVDYEEIRRGVSPYDVASLRGRTFWDVASKARRRVCVVNPLLAYPVWPVNGIMVNGPVFVKGEAQSFPPALAQSSDLPLLGGMTDFPRTKQLDRFIMSMQDNIGRLAKYGLDLLRREPWDLFFISFFELDRLQHFLWRFFDREDPTYPGTSLLQDAIPSFYRLFDGIIGQYEEASAPDAELLIISDHGHGRRPIFKFHVNEVLRRHGLLKGTQECKVFAPRRWTEQSKNAILAWLADHGRGEWATTIGRLLPSRARVALKKSSFVLDRSGSSAWASEVGGGSSSGGVVVDRRIRQTDLEQYERIRSRVKCSLLRFEDGSGPVIRWITEGERVLGAEDLGSYPDLVFELNEDYSVGYGLYTEPVTRDPRHERVSGGHKRSGVCFLKATENADLPDRLSVLELFPLILSRMGLEAAPWQLHHPGVHESASS